MNSYKDAKEFELRIKLDTFSLLYFTACPRFLIKIISPIVSSSKHPIDFAVHIVMLLRLITINLQGWGIIPENFLLLKFLKWIFLYQIVLRFIIGWFRFVKLMKAPF